MSIPGGPRPRHSALPVSRPRKEGTDGRFLGDPRSALSLFDHRRPGLPTAPAGGARPWSRRTGEEGMDRPRRTHPVGGGEDPGGVVLPLQEARLRWTEAGAALGPRQIEGAVPRDPGAHPRHEAGGPRPLGAAHPAGAGPRRPALARSGEPLDDPAIPRASRALRSTARARAARAASLAGERLRGALAGRLPPRTEALRPRLGPRGAGEGLRPHR